MTGLCETAAAHDHLDLKANSEKLNDEIVGKRRMLTEYVFSDRDSV